MKDKLIKHLEEYGKDRSYTELFNLYPYSPNLTNKQKSDSVRNIWKKVKKSRVISINPPTPPPTGLKVLLFDIETAPIMGAVWTIWNTNLGPMNGSIQSDWFMFSWAAKWLHGADVISDVLTGDEALREDDSRITKSLWHLIDEADVIIGHNSKNFDHKKVNTKFLQHGLICPSPYQIIDTLTEAKKAFAFTSNKLDYIAQTLGVGKKIKTNMQLWIDCYRGNEEALKNMDTYCKMDVEVLEKVYLEIRRFIKSHPVIFEGENCHVCGSTNLSPNGTHRTQITKTQTHTCNNCGSINKESTKGYVASSK